MKFLKEHWESILFGSILALALGWIMPTLDHIEEMRHVVVSR